MKFFNDFFIPKQKNSAKSPTSSPDNQIQTNQIYEGETLDETGLPLDNFEGKKFIFFYIKMTV